MVKNSSKRQAKILSLTVSDVTLRQIFWYLYSEKVLSADMNYDDFLSLLTKGKDCVTTDYIVVLREAKYRGLFHKRLFAYIQEYFSSGYAQVTDKTRFKKRLKAYTKRPDQIKFKLLEHPFTTITGKFNFEYLEEYYFVNSPIDLHQLRKKEQGSTTVSSKKKNYTVTKKGNVHYYHNTRVVKKAAPTTPPIVEITQTKDFHTNRWSGKYTHLDDTAYADFVDQYGVPINEEELFRYLSMNEYEIQDTFSQLPNACYWHYDSKTPAEDAYPRDWTIHIDNGANILAVVHVDVVAEEIQNTFKKYKVAFKSGAKRDIWHNGAFDDHIGLYTFFHVFPALGVNVDVLITTNEEIGATTARDFNSLFERLDTISSETIKNRLLDIKDRYNWLFQIDRNSHDVVMYDYDTPELREMLGELGIKVGNGSFTCIKALKAFSVAGFNWGTGYHLEHTLSHFWVADEYVYMINQFMDFYNKYKDTKLTYTPTPVYAKSSAYRGGWDDTDYYHMWDEYTPYASKQTGTQKKKKKGQSSLDALAYADLDETPVYAKLRKSYDLFDIRAGTIVRIVQFLNSDVLSGAEATLLNDDSFVFVLYRNEYELVTEVPLLESGEDIEENEADYDDKDVPIYTELRQLSRLRRLSRNLWNPKRKGK